MKDFLGKELTVGDTVIMIAPGYRMLCKGTVKSFSEQRLRVEYVNDWNHSPPGYARVITQSPEQLVKVESDSI